MDVVDKVEAGDRPQIPEKIRNGDGTLRCTLAVPLTERVDLGSRRSRKSTESDDLEQIPASPGWDPWVH